MKKKNFFKRNWDILLVYIIQILSFLIGYIAISGCHGGFECLGFIMIPVIGILISIIFIIVFIIRNIKNKYLRTWQRWISIVLPILLFIYAFYLNFLSVIQ